MDVKELIIITCVEIIDDFVIVTKWSDFSKMNHIEFSWFTFLDGFFNDFWDFFELFKWSCRCDS